MIHNIHSKLSVAPMLDWTDKHYRFLMRLITKDTLLYTEMINVNAILHGPKEKLLSYNDCEHPIAFQIGGSEPDKMAEAAKIIEDYGYDEININAGCPSERVACGSFGASLIGNPKLVAECISEMQNAVKIPITLKTRIGIDDNDSYEYFHDYIKTCNDAGCNNFIIHSRKAILNRKLSTKQNREIPTLKPEYTYKLKQDFKNCFITFNGNVQSLEEAKIHLEHVDGIMIGRKAYADPYMFINADKEFFDGEENKISKKELVEAYIPYIQSELAKGEKLGYIAKHILTLFTGIAGAKQYRRHLSENMHKNGANEQIIIDALKKLT